MEIPKNYCSAIVWTISLGLACLSSAKLVKEPEDVFAFQGGSAGFPCQDDEADYPPVWNISGKMFYFTHLPSKITVTRDLLTALDVDKHDNGSTYQCIFESSQYTSVSRVGTLYVYSGKILSLSDRWLPTIVNLS